MAITPVFMADPPQFIRTGTSNTDDGVYCALGDRWSKQYTGVTYTYKCTTPGTPDPGGWFNPGAGVTPFTYGTSVWTLVTPSSWANAATMPYKDSLHYVDCNARFPFTWYTGGYSDDLPARAVIYVEPSTMRPRNGWSLPTYDPQYNYSDPSNDGGTAAEHGTTFFGAFNATNYHGRRRFGDARTVTNFFAANPRVDVTADFTTGDASQLGASSRGVQITTAASGAVGLPTQGVAVTLNAPNASSVSVNLLSAVTEKENSHVFGVHTNHSVGGVLNPQFTPNGSTNLFRTAPAYMSDNSNPPLRSVMGSSCALSTTSVTYRDGAATGGDEQFSFLTGGHKFASFGAMWLFPFIYLQNTLTGTRTITVHFLTDSPFDNDLTNMDIWLDVFYPSSNTTPKYSHASSEHANWGVPGVAGTALTADASTWTAPTIYFPTAFKISVTVTIQKAGMLLLRPVLAGRKISQYVLFMCPYVDVA